MNVDKIEKLEELLILPKGAKIQNYKIKRLTAAGENYGSLMLSVDVVVEGPNGTEEIHAVAKMVPPNDFIQEMFNTQVTFRNEISFYRNIVPLLRNFQREHGVDKVIDFFPEYYGGRFNLENDDTGRVDANAVLVLENLKIPNFVNLDRFSGLDLEVAKLVIIDLAHLHAVPIALKIQKPDVFEKEIKPHLYSWEMKEIVFNKTAAQVKQIIDSLDELKPLSERIMKGLSKLLVPSKPREPWATINHNDCWVNNTMVKLNGEKPVKNKMVDFQICSYGSPAVDVVFFLFSSVKSCVLEKHYDDLIQLYHDTFISILKTLNCDTAAFSREAFTKELSFEAASAQFGHVIFMLNPIFAPTGSVKELDQLRPEDMRIAEPTELYKEKMTFVVKEFIKRNWI